jgi:uncharacterized protein (DUF2126 family)
MKYYQHMLYGSVASYQPEGVNKFIPPTEANIDYVEMMEEVESGAATIEIVHDTPE